MFVVLVQNFWKDFLGFAIAPIKETLEKHMLIWETNYYERDAYTTELLPK